MASNAENVSIWWRHHDDGIRKARPSRYFYMRTHGLCSPMCWFIEQKPYSPGIISWWRRGMETLTTCITGPRCFGNFFAAVLNRLFNKQTCFWSLQWRHNERDGVLNHQPHDCLLNRLFKAPIKENINAPRQCNIDHERNLIHLIYVVQLRQVRAFR